MKVKKDPKDPNRTLAGVAVDADALERGQRVAVRLEYFKSDKSVRATAIFLEGAILDGPLAK